MTFQFKSTDHPKPVEGLHQLNITVRPEPVEGRHQLNITVRPEPVEGQQQKSFIQPSLNPMGTIERTHAVHIK